MPVPAAPPHVPVPCNAHPRPRPHACKHPMCLLLWTCPIAIIHHPGWMRQVPHFAVDILPHRTFSTHCAHGWMAIVPVHPPASTPAHSPPTRSAAFSPTLQAPPHACHAPWPPHDPHTPPPLARLYWWLQRHAAACRPGCNTGHTVCLPRHIYPTPSAFPTSTCLFATHHLPPLLQPYTHIVVLKRLPSMAFPFPLLPLCAGFCLTLLYVTLPS